MDSPRGCSLALMAAVSSALPLVLAACSMRLAAAASSRSFRCFASCNKADGASIMQVDFMSVIV